MAKGSSNRSISIGQLNALLHFQRDLGVISLDQKCLLKTEQDLLRNEAQGFFISEPELSVAKQQFKPSVN